MQGESEKYQEIIRRHYGEKYPPFCGDQLFADYNKFARVSRLSGLRKWRYYFKIWRGFMLANTRLFFTLLFKRCYYGPFKGEFGNFLGHNLPFLAFLHSKGVRIYYCGMLLHKPFLVDEKGNDLVEWDCALRDFFREVLPSQNDTIPPPDVQKEIEQFERKAKKSIYPFFNVGDPYYYWFIHRSWLLRGFMKTTDFTKIYQTKDENSVVIFPRSKGARSTPNNGEPWDWNQVAEIVSPYFEKVYVLGHPAFSSPMSSSGNIEVLITDDNSKILEKCCNSKLIITQHSGTCYLGEYTGSRVLIIFRGKFPIAGINDSIIFKEFIGVKFPFAFSFSEDDIRSYVKNLSGYLRK